MEFARLVSNELVIGEGRGPGVRSGCDSGLVGTSRQSYRQRGRLVVLTRMVYRPPGADPCQLPDLLRRRIRTEASEGRSLGWVVAVVVTELVLLLSLGVGAGLEISVEPAGPTELGAGRSWGAGGGT